MKVSRLITAAVFTLVTVPAVADTKPWDKTTCGHLREMIEDVLNNDIEPFGRSIVQLNIMIELDWHSGTNTKNSQKRLETAAKRQLEKFLGDAPPPTANAAGN